MYNTLELQYLSGRQGHFSRATSNHPGLSLNQFFITQNVTIHSYPILVMHINQCTYLSIYHLLFSFSLLVSMLPIFLPSVSFLWSLVLIMTVYPNGALTIQVGKSCPCHPCSLLINFLAYVTCKSS